MLGNVRTAKVAEINASLDTIRTILGGGANFGTASATDYVLYAEDNGLDPATLNSWAHLVSDSYCLDRQGVTMSAVRPNTTFTFETLRSCTLVIVGNYDATKKVTWVSECERWFTVSGEGFWSLQDVANSL